MGKGLGRLVYCAAKRLYRCGAKDRGFESGVAVDFYLQSQLVF